MTDRGEPATQSAVRDRAPDNDSDHPGAADQVERGCFPNTLWTLVNQANHATEHSAHDARSKLCEMYWYPLYVFVRRSGCGPHDAEDVTQGFFTEFLSNDSLANTSAAKGRLRAYLKTCIKNYLHKWWRHARAQKRGGGARHFSIDQASAEERYGLEPSDAVSPDILYDRHWALMLMKRAHDRLEAEYADNGKSELFTALRGTLSRNRSRPPFAELARRFDATEENLRVMASRMRKRYKAILEDEVASTVTSREDIVEELNHLLTVFAD